MSDRTTALIAATRIHAARLLPLCRSAMKRVQVLHGHLVYERASESEVEHAREARARLEQMLFALARSLVLQRQYAEYLNAVDGRTFGKVDAEVRRLRRRHGRIAVALGFYAEAFYYFAHRATKCLHHVSGFKRFDPAGTRDARNHLIEHPVGLGGFIALHRNYTYDRPEGVVIKPYRKKGESFEHKDAGLYPNAEEFITSLLEHLARVAAAHPERRRRILAAGPLRRRVNREYAERQTAQQKTGGGQKLL